MKHIYRPILFLVITLISLDTKTTLAAQYKHINFVCSMAARMGVPNVPFSIINAVDYSTPCTIYYKIVDHLIEHNVSFSKACLLCAESTQNRVNSNGISSFDIYAFVGNVSLYAFKAAAEYKQNSVNNYWDNNEQEFGKAVVAGACTTVIKALFEDSKQDLMLANTLDRFALSGMRTRTMNVDTESLDLKHALLLGECVAIVYLHDYAKQCQECFVGFEIVRQDGTKINITRDGIQEVME